MQNALKFGDPGDNISRYYTADKTCFQPVYNTFIKTKLSKVVLKPIMDKKGRTKICMVPECKNTSLVTPYKWFIPVPCRLEIKKQWCDAVRRYSSRHLTRTKYCCEDHFNLREDLEESMFHEKRRTNGPVKMKPEVVPHIFNGCKNTKITSASETEKKRLEKSEITKLNNPSLDEEFLHTVKNDSQFIEKFNMEKTFMPSNTDEDENLSILGFEVTDVQSVPQALQNFIKFELDTDETEETELKSGDFLQPLDSSNSVEEVNDCEETENEQSDEDEQTDKLSNEKAINSRELSEDSDEDMEFEEIAIRCKEREKIVQQLPTDEISGSENTNNTEGGAGIHFMLLRDEDLDQGIILDDIKENKPSVKKSSKRRSKKVGGDVVEVDSSDDSDCIVVTDDENSNDAIITNQFRIVKKIKYCTENIDEETAEEDVLDDFEITDDEEGNICVVRQGTQNSRHVIRRTNFVFACPLNCTYLTADRKLMLKHLINHKKKKKIPRKVHACPLCPFETVYKNSFVSHIRNHGEPSFACTRCSYVADKPSTLQAHLVTKHGLPLTCGNCGLKNRKLGNYYLHQRSCGRKLKAKRFLKKTGKLRCQFDPCPYTANTLEALKTHEWIQHQVGMSGINNYKCYIDYCDFETFREDVFEDHLYTHPGCQLQCKECSYRTLDWLRFKDHVIGHVTNLQDGDT